MPESEISEKLTLVFLFDVLGFSGRVKELGLAEIYRQYDEFLDTISEDGAQVVRDVDLEGIPFFCVITWSMAYFSDTILLWTDYSPGPMLLGAAKSAACEFFCRCFSSGLPLRGAMAAGPAVMNLERRIFLGEPLIDAARAEAAQRCAGIGIAKSWPKYFGGALGRHHLVLPYEDHIKPGRETELVPVVLDWPSAWRQNDKYADQSLDDLIASYSRPGFETYWEATRRFIAYSESQPPWFDSVDLPERRSGANDVET